MGQVLPLPVFAQYTFVTDGGTEKYRSRNNCEIVSSLEPFFLAFFSRYTCRRIASRVIAYSGRVVDGSLHDHLAFVQVKPFLCYSTGSLPYGQKKTYSYADKPILPTILNSGVNTV